METTTSEKGIYSVILGLYGDNGQENGNCYELQAFGVESFKQPPHCSCADFRVHNLVSLMRTQWDPLFEHAVSAMSPFCACARSFCLQEPTRN